jgi:CRP-like cAMP-binding protein
MTVESFSAGHFLCTEGERGDAMFVLAEGEVDVIVATDEETVEPLATMHAGQAFGQGALVDNRPRTASCVARTNVTVLALDRPTWKVVSVESSPAGTSLRTSMIRSLSRQLSYANAQLSMLDLEAARKARDLDLMPLLRASAGLEAGYWDED